MPVANAGWHAFSSPLGHAPVRSSVQGLLSAGPQVQLDPPLPPEPPFPDELVAGEPPRPWLGGSRSPGLKILMVHPWTVAMIPNIAATAP